MLTRVDKQTMDNWSNEGTDGESEDGESMVTCDFYTLDGTLINSLQIIHDASIGNLERQLRNNDIPLPSRFTVGPPDAPVPFEMDNSYMKLMLTKVVKASSECSQEQNKHRVLPAYLIY